ncbi:YceD family protein [Paenibacillus sp. sgz500958]|uniref:YceD family protein n=1 Tax=Paenibacillus sp. sgz500958 TaxID=3242475 RepID=UPI0036D33FBE
MEVHFRKIANADEPLFIHHTMDFSELVKGRKDILTATPFTVDLKALPADTDSVKVVGKLDGDVSMLCARCLNEVSSHLNIPFAETFKWLKQPHLPEEEDEELIYIKDESVDLVPYVEETFVLHLPEAVLCKADCLGLCQKCGQNLNEGTCSCDNTVIDPRLAGLKNFFK